MNTQHTPGPWEDDATEKYYRGRVIRSAGRVIAEIRLMRGTQFDGMTPRPATTDANARLIAAAPDLLAAILHDSDCGFCESYGHAECNDCTRSAAIAKATAKA